MDTTDKMTTEEWISPEGGREIVRRYEQGESLYDIARSLHMRYQTVRTAFDQAGGTLKPTRAWENRYSARTRKLSDPDIDAILIRWGRGDTMSQLARDFGVSVSAIRYHVRQRTGGE